MAIHELTQADTQIIGIFLAVIGRIRKAKMQCTASLQFSDAKPQPVCPAHDVPYAPTSDSAAPCVA